MRILRLIIHNVGLIGDATIELNKPLIILYGEIRQGKSTALNCVRWCFGGAVPDDLIQHGKDEASIRLEFTNGSIERQFYRGRDGEVKAREIAFIRDGRKVGKPVTEISKFLNPFILDQNFLADKNEAERKQFFVELLGVDTKALDAEATDNATQASELRAKIKGYGDIDLTPVLSVDTTALRLARQGIIDSHAASVKAWRAEHDAILKKYDGELAVVTAQHQEASARATDIRACQLRVAASVSEIERLEKALEAAKNRKHTDEQWLQDNPAIVPATKPVAPDVSELAAKMYSSPDTTELDAQLSAAAANQVRYEQFVKNQEKAAQRRADEETLYKCEARQREIKVEKAAKLKEISESSGIPGLEFDEQGNLVFEGTAAGMISTSQMLRLSEMVSEKYPPGFSISLCDRAESLGKSVFDLVERAKAKERTILATVVGDVPAKIPEEVGVFIVDKGEVVPQN